jgi:hypothetical protein
VRIFDLSLFIPFPVTNRRGWYDAYSQTSVVCIERTSNLIRL